MLSSLEYVVVYLVYVVIDVDQLVEISQDFSDPVFAEGVLDYLERTYPCNQFTIATKEYSRA